MKKLKKPWAFAGAAGLLALLLLLTALWPQGPVSPAMEAQALREAVYPEMAQRPQYPAAYDKEALAAYKLASDAWRDSKAAQQRDGYEDALTGFIRQTVPVILSGAGKENAVYSPVNLYMALALLAEISGGQTRQQVLDLLGAENLESLRSTASDLWNDNYRDDGHSRSLLASSLWLNDRIQYDRDTLDRLAEDYYASSYQGTMGAEDYNALLHTWIDEQTENLLQDASGKLRMHPDDFMMLVSTICFKEDWNYPFREEYNTEMPFHSPAGKRTVTYMNMGKITEYYWDPQFGAIRLGLGNSHGMWLFLPDEGCDPADLLESGSALELAMGAAGRENSKQMMVDLSLPKFDVDSDMELIKKLQQLGITDAFDFQKADFAPLVQTAMSGRIDRVRHAARVVIDEEGLTAAALSGMGGLGGVGPPKVDEIDFVLDRPFLFIITSKDGLPLFTGIVNQP